MKLRMVRFLRTPAYDELFSGDPTWVDRVARRHGRWTAAHMVTKMSFRYLHTLDNLGPAPEPNLTVLWSSRLPEAFKRYCAQVSIDTSAIQYENDDLMRTESRRRLRHCLLRLRHARSASRCSSSAPAPICAKALLYAINGGRDETDGRYRSTEPFEPITRASTSITTTVMDKIRGHHATWLAQRCISTP